ncbi:MAG: hypothetical protein H2042_00700 [Rhizobiales bacterium]|nr:hypothetical protein [Hyphomicrobiales bacterium]
MPSLSDISEIFEGLVVHLDTGLLRQHGGCLSNVSTPERAVQGPHYFLVLEIDHTSGSALAVPLFSSKTAGGEKLDDGQKSGPPNNWIGHGQASWFSKFQHWKIPLAALVAASADDDGMPGNRRGYATTAPALLADIAASRAQNSNQTFRPVA